MVLEIKLNKLAGVITRCWTQAETNLAQAIAVEHWNPPEEFITFLLEDKLRLAVNAASASGQIERAFLADLRSQIDGFSHSDDHKFAGLIASVNPHTKPHESKVSAADFGLLIIRPQVRLRQWSLENIECSREHATALLVQAKLGHNKQGQEYRWGRLKKKQEDLFLQHQQYYSLLLYRLRGMEANKLEALSWQLCHGATVEDAKNWLRSGIFPGEIQSSDLLKRLFARQIGTEDPQIIKTVIAPDAHTRRTIEIHISWPPGSGPPPSCRLRHYHRETIEQKIYQ